MSLIPHPSAATQPPIPHDQTLQPTQSALDSRPADSVPPHGDPLLAAANNYRTSSLVGGMGLGLMQRAVQPGYVFGAPTQLRITYPQGTDTNSADDITERHNPMDDIDLYCPESHNANKQPEAFEFVQGGMARMSLNPPKHEAPTEDPLQHDVPMEEDLAGDYVNVEKSDDSAVNGTDRTAYSDYLPKWTKAQ